MAASAPYARRTLSGGALATTIVNLMGTGDGSCQLSSATNWPSGSVGPFFVVVDRNLNTEEKIECSGTSGTTLTFSNRGADGTSANTHQAGATIAICGTAQDLDESNQVVSAVLGQPSAAKGDILAMLSAAGPNTLTRIPITNGAALTAASSLPVWSAAGTAGQALLSNGSNAASFQSAVPLLAKDGAINGAAPTAPGPFSIIAGTQSVTFTSGIGTLTFAGGGFATGVLAISLVVADGSADVATMTYGTTSKTSAIVSLVIGGTPRAGSSTVSYIAIGF